jgi:hypothetical protein
MENSSRDVAKSLLVAFLILFMALNSARSSALVPDGTSYSARRLLPRASQESGRRTRTMDSHDSDAIWIQMSSPHDPDRSGDHFFMESLGCEEPAGRALPSAGPEKSLRIVLH